MLAIFKKEFLGYFRTPLAYIFLVIFLIVTMGSVFYIGRFFERGQADLIALMAVLPWMFLFFIPGICMRLWSEELASNTAELLLTLPISITQLILGKFLAAWCFISLAILGTFPLWITVSYLGSPDHFIIFINYLCCFLMAGSFVAISSYVSSLTNSQATAFVISLFVCLLFMISGTQMILAFLQDFFPEAIVYSIMSLSFLSHIDHISRGLLPLSVFVTYFGLMALFIYLNKLSLEKRRAV